MVSLRTNLRHAPVALALLGAWAFASPAVAKLNASEGPVGPCSVESVARYSSATALRELVDGCRENTELVLKALEKLNSLPLPEDQIKRLDRPGRAAHQPRAGRAVVGTSAVEHASFEISVYFGTGETYPTDEGIAALGELIARVNASGGLVKSVAVVGSVDATEAETALARGLARGRAQVVHRYFVRAGVDKSQIQAAIKTRPSTTSAAPRDRAAQAVLIVELPVAAPERQATKGRASGT